MTEGCNSHIGVYLLILIDLALAIAKNKLNSEFWEAKIRMYMADAPSYQAERCHNLKKA